MSEDFLSRWSQRKDAARREAERNAPDTVPPRADVPGPPATEPALTPEEIAKLPKLDALTADSDIACFLRRGVPEALRNAALRKMWMLDPAIRDFVGHARDYDYDWNTPGGVPGHGALEPGDDVSAMVRRIFGEADAKPSSQVADANADGHATPAPAAEGASAAAHHETAAGETKATEDTDPAGQTQRSAHLTR